MEGGGGRDPAEQAVRRAGTRRRPCRPGLRALDGQGLAPLSMWACYAKTLPNSLSGGVSETSAFLRECIMRTSHGSFAAF